MECIGPASELIPKMELLLTQGEGFWLTVTGSSMSPTLIHMRDKVFISPSDGVRKGDIILTRTHENKCILHRVVSRVGNHLYYQGDALSSREGPLPLAYVIGKVTKIQSNGKVNELSPLYNCRCMLRLGTYRFKRRLFAGTKKILGLFPRQKRKFTRQKPKG